MSVSTLSASVLQRLTVLKPLGSSGKIRSMSDHTLKNMVMQTQDAWAKAVLSISKFYRENPGDEAGLEAKVNDFVADFYAPDAKLKPTLATDVVFRDTKEGFLSYFRGNGLDEDSGFAIKEWLDITLKEKVSNVINDVYISGGQMTLTPSGGQSVTAEYSFTYDLKALGSLDKGSTSSDSVILKASWHHNSLTHKN